MIDCPHALAHKGRGLHVNWKDFIYFLQESYQWNDILKRLRQLNVLGLGGAERYFHVETTIREDCAVGIHQNITCLR